MDTIIVDGERINFERLMHRKQFVQDIKGYTRAFTFITVKDNEIYIGHAISGIKQRLTKIEFEHLNEWIEFFDRI